MFAAKILAVLLFGNDPKIGYWNEHKHLKQQALELR